MLFKRAPYPQEYRQQIVALVRSGRTPEELSREFEPSAQSIRNWVAASTLAAGRGNAVSSGLELEELIRLRYRQSERSVIRFIE
jgi:transposase